MIPDYNQKRNENKHLNNDETNLHFTATTKDPLCTHISPSILQLSISIEFWACKVSKPFYWFVNVVNAVLNCLCDIYKRNIQVYMYSRCCIVQIPHNVMYTTRRLETFHVSCSLCARTSKPYTLWHCCWQQ